MIKEGTYARFKNPFPDEIDPIRNQSVIMKVLEVDPPRVLVEFQIDAEIKPTARVALDALVEIDPPAG